VQQLAQNGHGLGDAAQAEQGVGLEPPGVAQVRPQPTADSVSDHADTCLDLAVVVRRSGFEQRRQARQPVAGAQSAGELERLAEASLAPADLGQRHPTRDEAWLLCHREAQFRGGLAGTLLVEVEHRQVVPGLVAR